MALLLATISAAVVIGLLLDGRVANLSGLELRWTGLALAGLCLQLVSGPGIAVPLACLYLSFVVLSVFAAVNLRVIGFPLILAGVALNAIVIGLNQGMPVAERAIVATGQIATIDDLTHAPPPKHHLATGDDLAMFLGDVIAMPRPIAQAISVGDVLTYAGIGVVIVAGMRAPALRRGGEDGDADPAAFDEPGTLERLGAEPPS
ncbi:MAG: DUF5317 family protein [Actinomycetota bacterium]